MEPSSSGIWVDGEKIVPGNRTPYNVLGKSYEVMPTSLGYLEIGIASWYGKKFHGRLTSNGETYDMYSLSAAHKALPLPSMVRVTNLDNGKKTILRVNDRGPFHDDRIIDLSYKAAMELGFANKGTAPVVVEAIDDQNYPELVHNHGEDLATNSSYFLQIGAFSRVQGAETLMQQIQDLMVIQTQKFPVRILQSELTSGILYKVWIGPIDTESEEEEIATLVVDAALGTPIKVEIE
jgi:rare lipoprotein A